MQATPGPQHARARDRVCRRVAVPVAVFPGIRRGQVRVKGEAVRGAAGRRFAATAAARAAGAGDAEVVCDAGG